MQFLILVQLLYVEMYSNSHCNYKDYVGARFFIFLFPPLHPLLKHYHEFNIMIGNIYSGHIENFLIFGRIIFGLLQHDISDSV